MLPGFLPWRMAWNSVCKGEAIESEPSLTEGHGQTPIHSSGVDQSLSWHSQELYPQR